MILVAAFVVAAFVVVTMVVVAIVVVAIVVMAMVVAATAVVPAAAGSGDTMLSPFFGVVNDFCFSNWGFPKQCFGFCLDALASYLGVAFGAADKFCLPSGIGVLLFLVCYIAGWSCVTGRTASNHTG